MARADLIFLTTLECLLCLHREVQATTVLTINGETYSVYETTASNPVTILCTTTIDGEGDAFVTGDRSIWRAVDVSSNLSASSPLWQLVYNGYKNDGYFPDQLRMSEVRAYHPSIKLIRTGMTIDLPTPSDSGMYSCSGIFVPQPYGNPVTEYSNQIFLSITTDYKFSIRMAVGGVEVENYLDVGTNYFPLDFYCSALVTDTDTNITGLQILKSQSFVYGHTNETFYKDWAVIYDSNWTAPLPGHPFTTPLQLMRSRSMLKTGFSMKSDGAYSYKPFTLKRTMVMAGQVFAHAGSYKCRAFFVIKNGLASHNDSEEFKLDVVQAPSITIRMKSDAYGSSFKTEISASASIITGSAPSLEMRCRVDTYNLIPDVAITVSSQRAYEKAYNASQLVMFDTKGGLQVFNIMIQESDTYHDINISNICNNTELSCTAWISSRPMFRSAIKSQAVSDICTSAANLRLYNSGAIKVSTWITTNQQDVRDGPYFPVDLVCNSTIFGGSAYIKGQQVLKFQTSVVSGKTNWTVIFDSSWSQPLPAYPLTIPLASRRPSSLTMSSGFRMPDSSTRHTGTYKCRTLFDFGGSQEFYSESAEYYMQVKPPPLKFTVELTSHNTKTLSDLYLVPKFDGNKVDLFDFDTVNMSVKFTTKDSTTVGFRITVGNEDFWHPVTQLKVDDQWNFSPALTRGLDHVFKDNAHIRTAKIVFHPHYYCLKPYVTITFWITTAISKTTTYRFKYRSSICYMDTLKLRKNSGLEHRSSMKISSLSLLCMLYLGINI